MPPHMKQIILASNRMRTCTAADKIVAAAALRGGGSFNSSCIRSSFPSLRVEENVKIGLHCPSYRNNKNGLLFETRDCVFTALSSD